MTEKIERRSYNRFQIGLVTQITATAAGGGNFQEKTVLRNLSGGGASFITKKVDNYFKGQRLSIKIDLPGTDDVRACMKGAATVVRIGDGRASEADPHSGETAVAVIIEMPLKFERLDEGTL